MKKTLSIIVIVILLVGCVSMTAYGAWAGDRVEKITYYYNNGFYCEAMDELSWLNASKDRSIWTQHKINEMEDLICYSIENISAIYKNFGLIKSYLNQGFYYEAKDELNWLKGKYFLAPTEDKLWGEYNLDATTGITKYEEKLKQHKSTSQNNYISSYNPNTYSNSYTVYTTATGEKYHRAGCRYLKQSSYATTVSSARGRGYTACKICKP